MISKITIRKIDNGFVVKTEYPAQDFNHDDGEEFLQDSTDILTHVAHCLRGVDKNDQPN